MKEGLLQGLVRVGVSLEHRGKLHLACMRSCMVYGSEVGH
jgi:hypothetical protein